MHTKLVSYFAPPERATPEQLARDIECIARSPLVSGLLQAASGLLVVLNRERQIVAINETFLQSLGIAQPIQTLGLRLGETVGCIHAHEMPGGCGTSRYCSSCGAAIAMVSTLSTQQPVARDCVATVRHDGSDVDLCLNVRAHAQPIDGQPFILVFLEDVTMLKRWAESQRGFLHEIADLVSQLKCSGDALRARAGTGTRADQDAENSKTTAETVQRTTMRLAHEVALHKLFLGGDPRDYQLVVEDVDVAAVVREVGAALENHAAARTKRIRTVVPDQPVRLRTDPWLLARVLNSMLVNALEAMTEGDEARLAVVADATHATFSVWNRQTMPPHIALRMFERHHSTKSEPGRGLGAYSIKLIGERLLGGTVDFATSKSEGTVFRIALPLAAAPLQISSTGAPATAD